MKCVLELKEKNGTYRVFYDFKYGDWFVLTPNFKCSRNIIGLGLSHRKDEIDSRIKKIRGENEFYQKPTEPEIEEIRREILEEYNINIPYELLFYSNEKGN